MSTLLLTIAGPDKQAELAAPSETRIELLLPTFIGLTDTGQTNLDAGRWTLLLGDAELAHDRTLTACGVPDGATLTLLAPLPPRPPAEAPVQAGANVDAEPSTPSERTRHVLPERDGLFDRLSRAIAPGSHEPDSRPRAGKVTPGGAIDRLRDAWRDSDYTAALDDAIARPRVENGVTIAVLSAAPTAGRTTLVALLGSLLARVRGERVVAVDLGGGQYGLGPMLAPDHRLYSDDLLGLLGGLEAHTAQLDAHLGRGPDGLMVLPSPPDPYRARKLDRRAHIRLIEQLRGHPGLLLLDCPPRLQGPTAQAAVTTADQLLLVSGPTPEDIASTIDATRRLVRTGVPFTIVIDGVPRRGMQAELKQLASRVPDARGVLSVRSHPPAAELLRGASFTWDEATDPWRSELRELAVALTDQWDELELRPPEPDPG